MQRRVAAAAAAAAAAASRRLFATCRWVVGEAGVNNKLSMEQQGRSLCMQWGQALAKRTRTRLPLHAYTHVQLLQLFTAT